MHRKQISSLSGKYTLIKFTEPIYIYNQNAKLINCNSQELDHLHQCNIPFSLTLDQYVMPHCNLKASCLNVEADRTTEMRNKGSDRNQIKEHLMPQVSRALSSIYTSHSDLFIRYGIPENLLKPGKCFPPKKHTHTKSYMSFPSRVGIEMIHDPYIEKVRDTG